MQEGGEGCTLSDGEGMRHADPSGASQAVEDAGGPRRPIHAALVASGVRLSPWETRPLLVALGVRPHHLVRLGLVSRESLRGRGTGGRHGPHDGVPHGSPLRRGERPGPRGHHAPLGEIRPARPPHGRGGHWAGSVIGDRRGSMYRGRGGVRGRCRGGPDVAMFMPGQVPHSPGLRRSAVVHGPPPGHPFHGHHPHPAPPCHAYDLAAYGARPRGLEVLGTGSLGGHGFSEKASPLRRRPGLAHGPPHGPLHMEACVPPPGRPFHDHHPHPAPPCHAYGLAACGVRLRGHHVIGAGSPGGHDLSGEARVPKPRRSECRGIGSDGGGGCGGPGRACSPHGHPERRRMFRERWPPAVC